MQWFLRCTHRSAIGKMKPCATEALWREARFTVKKRGPAFYEARISALKFYQSD